VLPEGRITIHIEKCVLMYLFLHMMYKDRRSMWSFFSQGSFADTTLYHGHYTNESISRVSRVTYDMPPAYFFTVLACYIFMFVVLSVR
jgi:hypothetical protein